MNAETAPFDRLPENIKAGLVNLEYSRSKNTSDPAMNSASPHMPYFVDGTSAMVGQWVRLVFDERFWCVGNVWSLELASRVLVRRIEAEGGRAPKTIEQWRWCGAIQAHGAEWKVDILVVDDFNGTFAATPAQLLELERTLHFFPNHSYALGLRAQERLRTGDWLGASLDLTRLLLVNPIYISTSAILNDRGLVWLKLGKTNEAVDDFRQAISLEKNPNPRILFNLALSYRDQGSYEEALAQLDELLRIAPKYGHAWHEHAELLKRVGKSSIASNSKAAALKFDFSQALNIENQRVKWPPV